MPFVKTTRMRLAVLTAAVIASLLLPTTAVPGFSEVPEDLPHPENLTEITTTADAAVAVQEFFAAHAERGRGGVETADLRVYETDAGATIVAHRALQIVEVNEVAPAGTGDGNVDMSVRITDDTMDHALHWTGDVVPAASAHASHSSDSHTVYTTGDKDGCYGAYYNNSWIEIYDCYSIDYDGYQNGYYYYGVAHETNAQTKSSSGYTATLTDLDGRYDRIYGLGWAGAGARTPASAATKSCTNLTLQLSVAKVGISRPVEWCERWNPNWASDASWYTIDWDGSVRKDWRQVTYLLALRKYRCKCFKAEFTSSANYAV